MAKLSCLTLGVGFMLSTLAFPLAVGAQNPDQGPPFREGEIVVSGAPSSLSRDVKVLKFLPHANLTVIAAERGKEWGMVQKYRVKGRKAGLNYIAEAFTIDDPYYSYQWHFPLIQNEAAWDITTGAGVKVAVLDTGLAEAGEDGIKCITGRYNTTLTPAMLGSAPDRDGHGTHVSGTIAQATDNQTGVAGLAYEACIMPVKVLGDDGSGSFADISEGIHYAVDNGADVINMSLGINARYNITSDPLIDEALEHAFANNVPVICAAGNDGWRKNVSYPAIHWTTVAVGATGFDASTVRYSNSGNGLDIMAPGGNLSVDANGDGYQDGVLQETFYGNEWGYYFFEGTSMASPHVAAVAALVIADRRSFGKTDPTAVEMKEILTQSARDLGDRGYDLKTGWGLVQAKNALLYTSAPPPQPCTDNDGDGYCEAEDCDDDNSDVNPGTGEVCGDGLDNNCNKEVDEGCPSEECSAPKVSCSSNDECCSGMCHPIKNTCK